MPPPDLPGYLPPHMAVRVASALSARGSGAAGGGAVYVPGLCGTPA